MVNSSKVLTVSYGTFSCTLEGFDDSFDTMKAIAEYFRDLAADDRYFGAEPPTPDAEMLARIAEREVSRHVEAHQDGGKIVLRTALPLTSEGVQPDEKDEEAAQSEAKADALEQARLAEIAEQEAAQERARLNAEEARQAAKDADAQAEADAAVQAAAIAKAAEEAPRETDLAAQAEAEAERLAKEQAEEAAQAQRDAETEAQRDAELQAKAEADRKAKEGAAKQAEQDQIEPDSIAAKLARIRAVAGQPVEAPATPDFSEDEHADDIMQGQPGDTDLEDILELDDTPTTSQSDDATKEAISGVMAKLNESAPIEDELEELAETDQLPEDATDVAPAPQDAPKAPLRARVIKMKREEFEAAIASGDIEEEDEDDTSNLDDIAAEQVQDTSISRDDEDELARELAAVEAELAGLPAQDAYVEDTPEPVEDVISQSVEETLPAARVQSQARGVEDLAVAPDVEMDRLMDQASSELEEPDGKKRRNALGHLRAAVASARADKRSSAQTEPVDETLEYRDDLESAVQPRRPVSRLTADNTPASTARPPLKLVAEQRVDPKPEAPTQRVAETLVPTPVRPRRIKASATHPPAPREDDLAPEGGSFSEFAEEMGATVLPDLLEAAAAYLAYVEGKDQFSRPQLMTKVRMVQEDNFSREDGLRSFGQLLRQGKIEKISGGRFTVSDRISFKPDTRAVG